MSSNYVVVHYKDDFKCEGNKKDFFKKYFSDSILTGGGEIDDAKVDEIKKCAFIYFTDSNVAKRSADKKKITIGDFTFDVKIGKNSTASNKSVIREQIPIYIRPILIDGDNVGIM